MSRLFLPTAATLLAATFGLEAKAQDLTSGVYSCAAGGKAYGSVEIDGSRYRAAGEGWSSYSRIGPAILWNGALGAISAAGEVVGTTVSGQGFDIQIKPAAGDGFELVRCRK